MSAPKGNGSFYIYDDIGGKLIDLEIPKEEIDFIHEANADKRKDKLFTKVRKEEIRILMDSTQKIDTDTNMQNKLIVSLFLILYDSSILTLFNKFLEMILN